MSIISETQIMSMSNRASEWNLVFGLCVQCRVLVQYSRHIKSTKHIQNIIIAHSLLFCSIIIDNKQIHSFSVFFTNNKISGTFTGM